MFEVRKNDRAYQRGDILWLREWHPGMTSPTRPCPDCGHYRIALGHWRDGGDAIEKRVSFVYSGDPRFGGIEAGYVVLGIEPVLPHAAEDGDAS